MHRPNPKYGWSQRVADDLALREKALVNPDPSTDKSLDDFEDIVFTFNGKKEKRARVCGVNPEYLSDDGYTFMAWYDKHRWSRSTEARELELDNEAAIEEKRRHWHQWAREIWRNREPWDRRTEKDIATSLEQTYGSEVDHQDWAPGLANTNPDRVPLEHFWFLPPLHNQWNSEPVAGDCVI